MDNNGKNGFQYTYSAKDQAEVRRIREKYTRNKDRNKLERLRRLDARVTQRAQAVSLVFGVLGAFMLGGGMSLIMTDIGKALGMFSIVLGIIIGIIGGVLAGFAYPIYNYVARIEKEKVAPEIIRLTDELMK